MSENIGKIQCPSCGGPNAIVGNISEQECAFCGTVFTTKEVEDHTTKIKPENDKIFNYMTLAESALEGGIYDEATNYYNKILEEDTSHAASWLGKGTCIIWSSTLGDIKMPEALNFYKNAIKFGKGEKMKEAVGEELLHVIQIMYPNIESHYNEFIELDEIGNESGADTFFLNFTKLVEGLEFAVEHNPENIDIIEYGIQLAANVNKSLKTMSSYKGVSVNYIEKFIFAKQKLNPDWDPQEAISKSSGFCFIATATMGDYDHPVVMQLREFRDQYLLQRDWGRTFTKNYYKYGPYPANIISKSNLLKRLSYVLIVLPLFFITKKVLNK